MSFELYRQTQLGDCLTEALADMIDEGKLTQELALAVFRQFDQSILEALQQQVQSKAGIKAKLHTYRYFDNVWQFQLENVTFKLSTHGTGSVNNAPEITCDKAKVVCVDAKIILEQA